MEAPASATQGEDEQGSAKRADDGCELGVLPSRRAATDAIIAGAA